MIPLECGDPAQKPATYTRFVLPFSYWPVKVPRQKSSYFYRPIETNGNDFIWRKNYLTVETASVLFDRAKWFELQGAESHVDFRMHRGARNVTIRLAKARLVLFEWPKDPEARGNDEQKDPLCIGFLIVETSFPNAKEAPNLDDLLELNDKFRFWYQPYPNHEKFYQQTLSRCPIDICQPERTISDGDPSEIYFKRWASLLEIPVEDEAGKMWQLFPESWKDEAEKWIAGDRKPWHSGWIVYADNRTFVWTCAIVEQGGKRLQELFDSWDLGNQSRLKASSFGHWVKLLNVDRPESKPAETHRGVAEFERQWADEHTYHRWEESGTFYGFNYHCGAMLGPSLREPPLWQYFGEMYFDQILLLLYLRVGSFRFSRRLSRISAEAQDSMTLGNSNTDNGFEKWRDDFQRLRWSFALFTNLYEFPLLSNQQQSIEMYELARKHMDVEEFFREIQEEIRSSHDYLAIHTGQDQTETTTLLTVVATVGLTLGLVFGFWGMNILTSQSSLPWAGDSSLQLVLLVLSIAVFYGVLLTLTLVYSKPLMKRFRWLANTSKYREANETHKEQLS